MNILPYQEIERFFRFAPAELREIALELRNLVAEIAPTEIKDIRPSGIDHYFREVGTFAIIEIFHIFKTASILSQRRLILTKF